MPTEEQDYQNLVELYPQSTVIERTSYIRLEKSKNIKTSKEKIFFISDVHTEKEDHEKIEKMFTSLINISDESILKHENLFIKIKDDQLIRSYYITVDSKDFTPLESLESYFYDTKMNKNRIPASVKNNQKKKILIFFPSLVDIKMVQSNDTFFDNS